MQVWDSVAAARAYRAESGARHVVTVGVFDGVHRGHHAVIGAAADEARHITGTALLAEVPITQAA